VFAGGRGRELDIWAVQPGSDPYRLTSDPGTERYPAVFPDGSAVIYSAGEVGSRDLWLLPLDGGEPRRLTRKPGDDYAAAITVDVANGSVEGGAEPSRTHAAVAAERP